MNRRQFFAWTLASLSACTRRNSSTLNTRSWGREGLRDGAFLRPRAIGVRGDDVYVIDTTGRIQVFSKGGEFKRFWSTPSAENGTPTGVAFTADDRVLVPDTHYSRILEYTPAGKQVASWGEYGTGEYQFIYPTDIVESADGRLFVSEYGDGAERIHVFNAARGFIGQWGTFGEKPGQFNRAMAIDRNSANNLYVADTGNHRVQVFDLDGNLVRIFGAAGDGVGELHFPYDIAVAPDDSVLVADYGRHAILRYDTDGVFMGSAGGPGRDLGQFNGPRGLAVSPDGLVFVADTDNHRIQGFALEAVA